jgi:hypothetical protein
MRFFLIALLVSWGLSCSAQSVITLFRFLEDQNRTDFSVNMASANDSTFALLTADFSPLEDSITYRFLLIDTVGNVLLEKKYYEPNPDHVSEIASHGKNYYIYGTGSFYEDSVEKEGVYLRKLDSIGNTIYNKWYHLDIHWYTNGFDLDTLGNIFVAGVRSQTPQNWFVNYAKINPDGEIIYHDTLSFWDDPKPWMVRSTVLANQDFLITFYYYQVNDLNSDNIVELALIDGETGTVIWRKKAFKNEDYSIPIVANPDGSFSYFGGLDTITPNYKRGHFGYYTMDTLGNLLNQAYYEYPGIGGDPYPVDIKVLSNGEHVCLTSQNYIVSMEPPIQLGCIFLKFIHPDGSLGRERTIAYWQGEEIWQGQDGLNLTRMTVLSDDRILIGLSPDIITGPGAQHKDPWVLMLDSTGCPYPNCPDTIILMGILGGADDGSIMSPITIAPNPVNDHCSLLINTPLTEHGIWRLYDGMGRVLVEKEIPKLTSGKLEIDLSSTASGGYFWNLSLPDGKFWMGRLIKT